jgi:hypothetical protein
VSFAASTALIAAIRGNLAPHRVGVDAAVPRASLRADIAEGLRWLLGHRLLRALAVMVGLMNLATMAGQAILVLLAQEELGLGSAGYGLLTGLAVGGVLGSLLATRLSRRPSSPPTTSTGWPPIPPTPSGAPSPSDAPAGPVRHRQRPVIANPRAYPRRRGRPRSPAPAHRSRPAAAHAGVWSTPSAGP